MVVNATAVMQAILAQAKADLLRSADDRVQGR